ncbi:MAG TPA: hypothetical protein V6C91_12665 [Coleofasciculaceae cyanobacterium]
MYTLYLLETSTAKLFTRVSQQGKITQQDRYLLKTALLSNSLTPEELVLINRLLYAVRRGRVKAIDQL